MHLGIAQNRFSCIYVYENIGNNSKKSLQLADHLSLGDINIFVKKNLLSVIGF